MPKNKKDVEDDLDLENEEEEDEEEESEEEDEDDEEEKSEEESEEDEGEKVSKKKGKAGRPAGSKGKKSESVEGKQGIILLRTGVPKRVDILKVMGKNVKVRKPGDKAAPVIRIPITEVRLNDDEAFEKMEGIAEKITQLIDKNMGTYSKLMTVAARKSQQKRNPIEDL